MASGLLAGLSCSGPVIVRGHFKQSCFNACRIIAPVIVLAGMMITGFGMEAGAASDAELEAAVARPCIDDTRRSAYAIIQSCKDIEWKVTHDRQLLAKVLVRRAEAYRDLGRYDAARSDFSRALDAAELARGMPSPWAEADYPNWRARVLRLRARTSIGLHQLEGALGDLDASIAVAPQTETFRLRARIRLRVGMLDGAIDDADAVRSSQPTDDEYVGQKGYYLFAAGRYREALSAFREASKLDPSDRDWVIWGYLAMLRAEKRSGVRSDLPVDALKGWRGHMLRFLAGHISVDTFRGLAEREDHKADDQPLCEAELFIGQRLMMQGRMVAAIEVLRNLTETGGLCDQSFFEFQIARYELARMELLEEY